MTLAEFLAWEERQELRYEFDGFQPVAMTGGTAAHAVLQQNLAVSVGGRLRGTLCRMYGSDLKIEAAGSIRYPDAFVVCTPVAASAMVVRDPVVILEVLSPGTAGTDRIVKNREYAATPSVRRYVMLEQDRVAATVFARQEAGWVGHLVGEGRRCTCPRSDSSCRSPSFTRVWTSLAPPPPGRTPAGTSPATLERRFRRR